MNPFERFLKWAGIKGKRADEEMKVAQDDLALAIEEAIKEVEDMPVDTPAQRFQKRNKYFAALRRILKKMEDGE